MNKQGLVMAVLTTLITLGTALMALFGQEGVSNFSDISQVAYANAVIGALVAGFTGYKSRLMEKPKDAKSV